MARKVWLLFLGSFWVTMNVLLWRSEFGSGREIASSVPPEVVWQKILTAPDDSTLEVHYKGQKIGYCRWFTNAGEELATGKVANENFEPEGMVKGLPRYTADLDGNFLVPELPGRFRFEVHGIFNTNRTWREVTAKALLRPSSWEAKLDRTKETLELRGSDGADENWQRRFTFAQFRNPGAFLALLNPAADPALLAQTQGATNLSFNLKWEARHDQINIGHSHVRAYRLQARLVDRYQVTVLVSRVGEILKVELPNGILLYNDALLNL